MKISELQKEVHELAKSKGWYDQPRTPLELHMLIVSEIAEATEEARHGNPPLFHIEIDGKGKPSKVPGYWENCDTSKPEGELVELADAVIRIMDYCAYRGWNLETAIKLKHEYNKTRPNRHGGKLY